MKSFTTLSRSAKHLLSPSANGTSKQCIRPKKICNIGYGSRIGLRAVFTAPIKSHLDVMLQRHAELSETLASGNASPKQLAVLGKELSSLDKVSYSLNQIKDIETELQNLQEVVKETAAKDDKDSEELREMAMMEKEELQNRLGELEEQVVKMLVPRDPADDGDAILEVRAGTGGDEAGFFTMEVLQMYEKYAFSQGWRFEILTQNNYSMGSVRCCKEATAAISGEGVYGRLKYESGVHRVQRIPSNDTKLQTSAMSVAVLPEAEDVEVDINPKDLRIDVYRSSGAGGQHVNTTESAVRVTHIPTGVVVAIQDERSQHQNKAKALKILHARVLDEQRRRQTQERNSARSSMIGSGDRSERIRTYNYPQSRVTDHRVNVTVHDLESMMSGDCLDEFIDVLAEKDQQQLLEQLLESDAS